MDTSKALAWAQAWLLENGYTETLPRELVRERPWSQVTRFHTDHGSLYLKQVAPAFGDEAKLLVMLNRLGYTPITRTLANDDALICFLMTDSGTPLRNALKQNYRVDIFAGLMPQYAELQQDATYYVNEMLKLGLPDWRLARWPELYADLIAKVTTHGLPADTIAALQNLSPRVAEICQQIAAYNLPETLDHGDFQDNNVLIKVNKLVINDWSDAAITHPFFSLATWLDSAQRHHNIGPRDPRHAAMRDSYLNAWTEHGDLEKLQAAFALVRQLGPLHFCISFLRVADCPGHDDYPHFNDYLLQGLNAFIAGQNSQ